jgi:hypothetical protein
VSIAAAGAANTQAANALAASALVIRLIISSKLPSRPGLIRIRAEHCASSDICQTISATPR